MLIFRHGSALNKACLLFAVCASVLRALFVPGLRPDGSLTIRPIDDMSASMVNAATCSKEKLPCDTLDMFFASMRFCENHCLAL